MVRSRTVEGMSNAHYPVFLFAGGGTGGHLVPGIAAAHELLSWNPRARILFAGSDRQIEQEIVGAHALEHRALPVASSAMLRRHPARFIWRNWRAYCEARALLRRERPQAVIGLGGFASVPVALAASFLNVPVVLLEQNVVPGRATRWMCSSARRICLSFEETSACLPRRRNHMVTGNPVRREIAGLTRRPITETDEILPTLLILGGSQGAQAVNDGMLRAAERLGAVLSAWRIVHQAGGEQAESVARRYAELGLNAVVAPFFPNICAWYAKASLTVCRAGATTLAELACAGCPAILIPYPNSAGDHQLINARRYEAAGATVVVEQERTIDATADAVCAHLQPLLMEPSRRNEMARAMRGQARPLAARAVAEVIMAATDAQGVDWRARRTDRREALVGSGIASTID